MEALRPNALSFGASWPPLKDFLKKLFGVGVENKIVTKEEWVQRFTDVYSICVSTQENMYEKLYHNMDSFIAEYVQNTLKELENTPSSDLLQQYHNQWTRFKQGICLVDKLFSHLNRQYIQNPIARDRIKMACDPSSMQVQGSREKTTWLTIYELAILHWRELLLMHLADKLAEQVISVINSDRASPGIIRECDKLASRSVSFSFAWPSFSDDFTCDSESTADDKLQLYRTRLEKPLIRSTSAFYKRVAESANMENTQDVVSYVERTLRMIDEERKRVESFVPVYSRDILVSTSRDALVEEHITAINNCSMELLKTNDLTALSLLYKLFKPMKAMSQLRNVFSEYVVLVAKETSTSSVPAELIAGFISTHRKFHALIENCFASDKVFFQAYDESVFQVINRKLDHQTESSAFVLSLYIDQIVRRPNVDVQDIKNAITLFGYLSDKDLFYSFCLKALALRLLSLGSSLALASEEKVVAELRQCCSLEFILKLQKMLADFSLSSRLSMEFESSSSVRDQFSVQVFQTGPWPLTSMQEEEPRITDKLINDSKNEFEKFYNTKYTGRKLLWLNSISTVEVNLKFTGKPYTMVVTMPQYLILECLNDCDSVSMDELRERTKLSPEDLEKAIAPLTACQLLRIQKDGKKVVLNLNFQSQKIKHHLQQYAFNLQSQTGREGAQIPTALDMDRDHFLQALIVRILKARKKINHTALITEVVNEAKSRFLPSVAIIKRSIEALVERQFIQRSEYSPDEYVYLA